MKEEYDGMRLSRIYGDLIEMAVSKKFSVTVPDQIFDLLEEWADEQGRPTANLAAYLIEAGLRAAIDKKEFVPHKKRKEGNRP